MERETAGIEVRRASPDDFDEIARLWHASASVPGVAAPGRMPDIITLRRRITDEVAGEWDLFVATRACEIVGMLAIRIGKRVLDQIFVSPSEIGTGIGRALMAHAMRAMPTGFTLHTASTNLSARHFYERSGLMLLETSAHPRWGHEIVIYGWTGPP